MRNCPICEQPERTEHWTTPYKVPDGWPLPSYITWYSCNACRLIYGDGDFGQGLLDEYYRSYYGYGVDNPQNLLRLREVADDLAAQYLKTARIVDLGGGDGHVINRLREMGFTDAHNLHVGDAIPENVDCLFVSHVLEHIYDLPDAMKRIASSIKDGGELIIDGPDAMGIWQNWPMPMLDFNTKHVQHFTLYDYLNLARRYGFTLTRSFQYDNVLGSQVNGLAYRMWFTKGLSLADECRSLIAGNIGVKLARLRALGDMAVNVWGLGDVAWHLLSQVDLNVINYVDSDPAYRKATYKGKPVKRLPMNDAPIVIMAQGQRGAITEAIKILGLENEIIEI
jgi:hypothetical protein